MRHLIKKTCFAAITSATLIASTGAFAVNGALDYGFSEITRGMGGAGSALPQDTMIAAINPAGMVRLPKQFDVGAVIYFPKLGYNASTVTPTMSSMLIVAPGKHDSSKSVFFLPDIGYNYPLDNKSSLGISLYSLGGFGVEFANQNSATIAGMPMPGPLGAGTLYSDLKQAVTAITYARKFAKHSSWGVSLLVGLQTLKVNGVGNLAPLSTNPNQVSNKGTDYSIGAGVRFGVLFGLIKNLDLSVSYQPKIYMTKLTDYAGLLPDGGSFDMPAFGNIGLAWHVTPNFVFAGDIVKIWYTDIPAYGNSHDAILMGGSCTPGSGNASCLGGKNGAGFGWSDPIVYKIGAQWKISTKTTLRAGYNHSDQVVSTNYATENMITNGAIIRDLWSLGITQKISKKDAINGVLTFVPDQSLLSQNLFSGTAGQTVNLHASGWGFGLSWSRVLG